MRYAILLAVVALASPALGADPAPAPRKVEIRVTESGFEPQQVNANKGEPLTLVFLRTTELTCITAVDIPDENVKNLDLPLNKAVSVTVTPKKTGVEPFHCSAMGMGDGKLVVTER
jgi:plastocyanin domain-containing protein